MKKFIGILLAFVLILTLAGCGNTIAKSFGGTVTVNLEPDKKLMEVTWKDDSLWILTRTMREDEIAETYEFKQDTNWGIIEGKVILKESISK